MKLRIFGFAFVMLCMAVVAFAQDDTVVTDDDVTDDTAADDTVVDDDAFAATVEFSAPTALEADTNYDFTFTVANTTTGDIQRWIYDVEMFMPSNGYAVDETLTAPDALHGGTWAAESLVDDNGIPGIKWMFTGVVTSESYGDIREGESLDFAFKATTDGDAKDGFDWRLIALDEAAVEYELYGTAYISEQPDDDTATDDTATDDVGGDDDDDSGGGCGC